MVPQKYPPLPPRPYSMFSGHLVASYLLQDNFNTALLEMKIFAFKALRYNFRFSETFRPVSFNDINPQALLRLTFFVRFIIRCSAEFTFQYISPTKFCVSGVDYIFHENFSSRWYLFAMPRHFSRSSIKIIREMWVAIYWRIIPP